MMKRGFVKSALSKDKELKVWDGLYHEIMNEANGEDVMNYGANWILSHLE